MGVRAPAKAEPAGGQRSAARGPAPRAAPSEPRSRASPPGAWDQRSREVRRRPRPLLGHGESKTRGSRLVLRFRGYRRLPGDQDEVPIRGTRSH